MLAILRQEIKVFFSSAIGYLVIGFFIIANGLILWVFKGDYNILDYGFADLSMFFLWAPYIFIVLIPAITMKSFAEEWRSGTIEVLSIKPIRTHELVMGKFLGAWVLTVAALFPSIFYLMAIADLSLPNEGLDRGMVLSSYAGLTLLSATYTGIGIWASSITANQIVAFISAAILSWFFYAGFSGIGTLLSGQQAFLVAAWGLQSHFEQFTRGIISLSDIAYFISLAALFLILANYQIGRKQ